MVVRKPLHELIFWCSYINFAICVGEDRRSRKLFCYSFPFWKPHGELCNQGLLRVATSRLKMDLRPLIGSSLLALANSHRRSWVWVKLKHLKHLDLFFWLGLHSLLLIFGVEFFVDQKPLIFVKLVTFGISHSHRFPLETSQQVVIEAWLYLQTI